jgi:hypothetical protein
MVGETQIQEEAVSPKATRATRAIPRMVGKTRKTRATPRMVGETQIQEETVSPKAGR